MISDNKNWNLIGEYIDEEISGTQVNKTKKLCFLINNILELDIFFYLL